MDRTPEPAGSAESVNDLYGEFFVSQLEPHLQTMLYGKDRQKTFQIGGFNEEGILDMGQVRGALDRSVVTKKPKRPSSTISTISDRQIQYEHMRKFWKNGKISFVGLSLQGEPLPHWVITRLETACKSARYELPTNLKLLETMTPLQYLANFTRLYRGQNRRYANIYKNHKNKIQDYLEYEHLYPALTFMYGNSLDELNFNILCAALFIDKHSIFDLVTFIGICTYCDRLFWTAFLDMDMNTFTFWGPNRTALEFADFENLKWKLRGLWLPFEIEQLLYSLA